MGTDENKQPLNLDGQENPNQEEKVELSKTEYERLQNAEKSWKSSTTEAQRLSAVAEVVKDNSKFLKIYATDKSKAEFVASHWGYGSAKEMAEYLEKYYDEHPDEKKAPSEDDLYEKFEAKQEEKEAKKALNSFLKEKGITKDSKIGKEFMDEVEDYMEGKKWTETKIEKAISKAYSYVKGIGKFSEELEKVEKKLP